MPTSRLTQILFISLTTSLLVTECAGPSPDQTVAISELLVPRYPKAGEDVSLSCKFKLGGQKHKLYTVNWWREKDQFYTYKENSSKSKNAYSFPGINVKTEESTEEKVVLRNVNEDTSGVYKCEVMGEGPAFRTAVKTMEMQVIVPPDRIEIRHSMNRDSRYQYQAEDLVQLNCTAHRVKPRPYLVWRINGQEAERSEMLRFPDLEDHTGRVTSTLGLSFIAPKYFRNMVARTTCTAFVEGHEFSEDEEVLLDPSAAFYMSSAKGWTTITRYWWLVMNLFLLTVERRWYL